MLLSADIAGLNAALAAEAADIRKAELAGMKFGEAGMRGELREITEAVLGPRVARTWKGRVYDNAGQETGPAAFVYSKAPKIISFNAADNVVRARGHRFMAIPTDDAPRKAGGGRISVEEAERRFGRRLQFIDPADRGFHTPSRKVAGVAYLVLKDLVVRKSNQRWRNASAREKASGKRALSAVILFVLEPQVRARKRIDLQAVADRWGDATAAEIASNIGSGS